MGERLQGMTTLHRRETAKNDNSCKTETPYAFDP